jgi:hypothetical protein
MTTGELLERVQGLSIENLRHQARITPHE